MTAQEVISPVNTQARKDLGIKPGDTVRVMQKIQEKGKTRLQAFEGLVLAVKHGTEAGATFTVRKVASGVGVEKIFPLYSPMVDKIEVIKRTKMRRAKLYYIREKATKEIRRSMRNAFMVGDSIESDIAEKERLAKEAEAAQKAEEEAAAAAEASRVEEEAAAVASAEAEIKEEAEEEVATEKAEETPQEDAPEEEKKEA
jgi:large subunit ribosomal protein L19